MALALLLGTATALGLVVPPTPDARARLPASAAAPAAAASTQGQYQAGTATSRRKALAAGCCIVLKPSEFTPLTALAFAAICDEIGVPAGVVNVVTGHGAECGAALTQVARRPPRGQPAWLATHG